MCGTNYNLMNIWLKSEALEILMGVLVHTNESGWYKMHKLWFKS